MFILTVYNRTASMHVYTACETSTCMMTLSKCDASIETAMRCIKSAITSPSETDVPMNSERHMLFKYCWNPP